MRTATFATETFTCPSCIAKIEKAVGSTPGVESTRVMFNSSKVKVSFDDAVTSAEQLATTIGALGYAVLKTKVA